MSETATMRVGAGESLQLNDLWNCSLVLPFITQDSAPQGADNSTGA